MFISEALKLGNSHDIDIAESFILSQKGQTSEALGKLAKIDTEVSHSAALMIVAYPDKFEESRVWMKQVGYTIQDFDPDGKAFLISSLLGKHFWEESIEASHSVSESDLSRSPYLYQVLAFVNLIQTVPLEYRSQILEQPPFNLNEYNLNSTPEGVGLQKQARLSFLSGIQIAQSLGCKETAKNYELYVLWLELVNTEFFKEGKERLVRLFGARDHVLSVFPYALKFGLNPKLKEIEDEIERDIAFRGEVSREASVARFYMALIKPTREEVAAYIHQYHDQIAKHFDTTFVNCFEIENFVYTGQKSKALKLLEQLSIQGLSKQDQDRLQSIIDSGTGDDAIGSLEKRFNETSNLIDLEKLVDALYKKALWEPLCKYGQDLFCLTKNKQHAKYLASAFYYTDQFEEIVSLFRNNSFLESSKDLKVLYAWGEYCSGNFKESKEILESVDDLTSNLLARDLVNSLLIANGDWNALPERLEYEFKHKDNRSPGELVQLAQLAFLVEDLRAKDILFSAVEKANEDPVILSNAYFLSVQAGWDAEPEVSDWLNRAIAYSSEDGPLTSVNFQDLAEMNSAWNEKMSAVSKSMCDIESPMFIAAKAINRTLVEHMLFASLINDTNQDVTKKAIIPAYSGSRGFSDIDLNNGKIILDATALLTLGALHLLDESLDSLNNIYIPHATLDWLLSERRKITFHQKSSIVMARELQNLISEEIVSKFSQKSYPDKDLNILIGDDLALFISEAKNDRLNQDNNSFIVRPYPVYGISNFLQEIVDLSEYEGLFCDCTSVVKKLQQKALLTQKEVSDAYAYLRKQEGPWPNQPEIADGATLYMDDISVTYFQHLGLLKKIKSAGMKIVIPSTTIQNTIGLIEYSEKSKEVKNVIEYIRSSLFSRLSTSQLKVGKISKKGHRQAVDVSIHPTANILEFLNEYDGIIIEALAK